MQYIAMLTVNTTDANRKKFLAARQYRDLRKVPGVETYTCDAFVALCNSEHISDLSQYWLVTFNE